MLRKRMRAGTRMWRRAPRSETAAAAASTTPRRARGGSLACAPLLWALCGKLAAQQRPHWHMQYKARCRLRLLLLPAWRCCCVGGRAPGRAPFSRQAAGCGAGGTQG